MSEIRAVALDLDGTLTESWKALPGAVDALSELRSANIRVCFLTNATTMTRAELAKTLRGAGLEVEEQDVLTALTATAAYLRAHYEGRKCFLIAKPGLEDDLQGVELDDDADVVVIAGAEEFFTFERLNHAFRLLMTGAPLVTMHRNLYWKTAGGLTLDAGAFVTALEAAAGVEAEVVGKPSRAFFDQAVDKLQVPRENIAMVGDDLSADVLGAQAAGLKGILVRTGKFRPEQLQDASGTPWRVVDSVARLPSIVIS